MSNRIKLESILSQSELNLVAELNENEMKNIDKLLVASACQFWRKVSRVVSTTMSERNNKVKGIPDTYYAYRVTLLAEKGVLEIKGNPINMQFSEVRLVE